MEDRRRWWYQRPTSKWYLCHLFSIPISAFCLLLQRGWWTSTEVTADFSLRNCVEEGTCRLTRITCCSVLSPEIVMNDAYISTDVQGITLNASCMTISSGRTEQFDIFCRVTGFRTNFLSFIVVELIRFFHGALRFIFKFHSCHRPYHMSLMFAYSFIGQFVLTAVTSCLSVQSIHLCIFVHCISLGVNKYWSINQSINPSIHPSIHSVMIHSVINSLIK